MLIYAAPKKKEAMPAIPGRPHMTYRYAFPEWFDEHHLKVIKTIHKHLLIDTTQLIRATGYPERRIQHLLKLLRERHYVKAMERMLWRQNSARRRSFIWGLLPRGALVCSFDAGHPFASIRVFEDHRPTPRYAEHAVDVASICISLTQHAQLLGLTVDTWVNDIEWRKRGGLKFEAVDAQKGEMIQYRMEPDGLMVLKNSHGAKRYLFVEADRANRNDWRRKIKAYKSLYLSGAFHRIFGISDLDVGFQVLVTTLSEGRARHMRHEAEAVGMADLACLFHFTTNFAAAETANVYTDPIWTQGGRGEEKCSLTSDELGEKVPSVSDQSGLFSNVRDLARITRIPSPHYQLGFEI